MSQPDPNSSGEESASQHRPQEPRTAAKAIVQPQSHEDDAAQGRGEDPHPIVITVGDSVPPATAAGASTIKPAGLTAPSATVVQTMATAEAAGDDDDLDQLLEGLDEDAFFDDDDDNDDD